MDEEIKVSIIVLTYYHEQYIEAAIDSVLQQKCDFNYEIIIADDSSKDNTINILQGYKNKLSNRMKIILHDKNVGTTKNLYDAYMQCNGKYIVHLSGDDKYTDVNKLQKQVDFLEFNRDYVGVGTSVKQIYSDGTESGLIFPDGKFRGKEFKKEKFLLGYNYPVHGLMFRNIFIDKYFSTLAKEQFKKMYEFSKYIEDLTLNFFLYDYGRIFVLYDITYAVLTRKNTDVNQHNYNSIRNNEQIINDHLSLLKELQEFYGLNINMQKRFETYINECLKIALLKGKFAFLKSLRGVPVIYVISSALKGLSRKILRKGEQ